MNVKKTVLGLLVLALAALIGGVCRFEYGDPDRTCTLCHEIRSARMQIVGSAHSNVNCKACHGGTLEAFSDNVRRTVKHLRGADYSKFGNTFMLSSRQVDEMTARCAKCHAAEAAQWKKGGLSKPVSAFLANKAHNAAWKPADQCLRCHGMFLEGDVATITGRTDLVSRPAVPCLACHTMHAPDALALYARADGFSHPAKDLSMQKIVTADGKPVRRATDARTRLCVNCHAAAAEGVAGSGDDRTPLGAQEGMACTDCHNPHGGKPDASRGRCPVNAVPPRPRPSPQLAARLKDPVEVLGIVHYSLNTYTGRQWGYGDEDPKLFDPAHFDAEQIVGACRDGGLQGLVMVAKHHDGFCLWPTKTTAHNISKSPFRGGKGDYVREMVDACVKFGLKYGFYCSPWDRNNARYASPDYVTTYWNQVRELFSQYGKPYEIWFDGANGGDGYYGGAREKRIIPKNYYRFKELVDEIHRTQPQVCMFYDYKISDFHYPGNESGDLHPEARATYRNPDEPGTPGWPRPLFAGDPRGTAFSQPECDVPLRAQWFWDPAHDGLTKPPAYLMKMYLRTVGNGGTLDLGIAPTRDGVLSAEDTAALKGFGAMRRRFFAKRVAEGVFPAGGGAAVRVPGARYNVVVLKEDVSDGERIDGWTLEDDAAAFLKGVSVGIKRIRVLEAPRASDRLVFRVTATPGAPRAVSFALYLAPEDLVKEIRDATCPQRAMPRMERAAFFAAAGQTVTYRLPLPRAFDRLYFLPDRSHPAATPLKCRYSFSTDGRTWSAPSRTFDLFAKGNPLASADPVPMTLGAPVTASWIRLEALGLASPSAKAPACGGVGIPR